MGCSIITEASQQNLRRFFLNGLFASASDSIILTYLTLFVLSLGATSSNIGLITALAGLSATFLLIPGAMLIDKTGNHKKIVLLTRGVASNVCILLLAVLPLVIKGKNIIWIAIAIKVIMDGLWNFSLPVWIPITADVIPLSWRGKRFATRNLVMGFSALVMNYFIGQVISLLGEPVGYQWSLLLAFCFGIISAGFFSRIRDYRNVSDCCGIMSGFWSFLWWIYS